jgi:hypothetical protein
MSVEVICQHSETATISQIKKLERSARRARKYLDEGMPLHEVIYKISGIKREPIEIPKGRSAKLMIGTGILLNTD